MWHRDLLQKLSSNLPRWRWKHRLGHRGGYLEGTSQKDRVRVELTHAWERWDVGLYRQTRNGPRYRWALASEATATDLNGLVSNIQTFCEGK